MLCKKKVVVFLTFLATACGSEPQTVHEKRGCNEPKVTMGDDPQPMDYRALRDAQDECSAYSAKSPCVKEFKKIDDNQYKVKCGPPPG
jgi:hypothetical protein